MPDFVISLILGLLVGSFLNVVIFRLPVSMQRSWARDSRAYLAALEEDQALKQQIDDDKSYSIVWPPSSCPSCNQRIKPQHNVPVLSYLWLKGKCAHCAKSISSRYPMVELATGVLSLLVYLQFGFSAETLAAWVLTWSLIALTGIDFDTQYLPDDITLPLLWLGLILNSNHLFATFQDAFWGCIAAYLSLWSIFWLFKWITGKEGMGYGDFKLYAALGAWLGWQYLPMIILLAAVSGLTLALIMKVTKKTEDDEQGQAVAFGPHLATAGWVSLMYGATLAQWIPVLFIG